MTDTTVVRIEEHPVQINPGDNTPSRITITDNTTAEVTVLEQVTNVTVYGDSPSLTIVHGGTRGPIYDPTSSLDRSAILAYLINGIENSHLNTELQTKIDDSTTGLAEAREDLEQLITDTGALSGAVDVMQTSVSQSDAEISSLAQRVTSVENGDIEALQSQITQTADDITLAAARLNTAEGNLSNAQIAIDAQGVQITAIEDNFGATITAQMSVLANEFTMKIQEDPVTGDLYAIGLGAIITPDWIDGKYYEEDEDVWFDEAVYRCTDPHTASVAFRPDVAPNKWELVPGGVKSQIGFDAEQIYFRTQTNGTKFTPLVIQGDSIYLNGNMVATGSVSAAALDADDIYSFTFKSKTWTDPTKPGWYFDATTGQIQMRGMTMTLDELCPTEAGKLSGIAAGADKTSSVDLGAQINSTGTKITGSRISTTYLSSIVANLGSITAGQLNFGAFIGYAWPAGTGTGAHMSAGGILMGNPSTGQYFQLTAAGQMIAPGLNINNGNATFSGTLSANTVTTTSINGNAVTEVASEYYPGQTSGYTSLATLSSLVVSTLGGPVAIDFSGYFYSYNSSSSIRIYNGSSLLVDQDPDANGYFSITLTDEVTASGNNTFHLKINPAGGALTWMKNFNFRVISAKK